MRVDEKTGSLRKLEARLVARGWMKAFPGWDRIVYMGCRDFYFERVQREFRWSTPHGTSGAFVEITNRGVIEVVLTFFQETMEEVPFRDGYELQGRVSAVPASLIFQVLTWTLRVAITRHLSTSHE